MLIRLCLLCLLTFGSCQPIFQREISSRVIDLEGSALVRTNGQTLPLKLSTFLPPGANASVPGNARVALMLLPGVLVELSGDAELEIVQLQLTRDGDESIRPMIARAAEVRLRQGTLVASVGQAQTDSSLSIETPDGIISATSGRTFKLIVTGNKTRILSLRNPVIARQLGGENDRQIARGYLAELPPTATGPQAAAEAGPAAQAELAEVLQVEKRLLLLAKEHGSDFKPW